MIQSFACKQTSLLWAGHSSRNLPTQIQRVALRKLAMIDTAQVLSDLTNPPGNRLEALQGGRKGQHSIRANDQWRICFVWDGANAHQVEIVDYH